MTTDTLIRAAKNAGVDLRIEGDKLKIRGSTEVIELWTPRLREHKAALIVALTDAMRPACAVKTAITPLLAVLAVPSPHIPEKRVFSNGSEKAVQGAGEIDLERNEQSGIAAMRQKLLEAADRICDFHGSTEAGRQSLRLHCKGIEPQFMQWWIDSYEKSYPKPL